MPALVDHADHHHAAENRLLLAFVLTVLVMVGEALGGVWSGSLALLADAGHMLVDALALLLAWAGAHFARRPADARRSFGYARLEVLAGYSNALIQFVLVAWIVYEAASRLLRPEPILSGVMLLIALASLLVNGLVLRVLHVGGHSHDDLNLRGASLHVLGDLLGSLGAVLAALAIRYFGWLQADPLLSIVVSLLILRSAWQLLARSGHILLEGTPDGIELAALITQVQRDAVLVRDVHHVHVWQLAGGRRMATLHARLAEGAAADAAIAEVQFVLREHFHILHSTVQIESGGCADGDCSDLGHAATGKHDHAHG